MEKPKTEYEIIKEKKVINIKKRVRKINLFFLKNIINPIKEQINGALLPERKSSAIHKEINIQLRITLYFIDFLDRRKSSHKTKIKIG